MLCCLHRCSYLLFTSTNKYLCSLTSTTGTANNGTVATESEPENGVGGAAAPAQPGPEATPRERGRLSHGHVKSASISAGSGNPQSTITNREAVASASAAERDSQRWRHRLVETFYFFCMSLDFPFLKVHMLVLC